MCRFNKQVWEFKNLKREIKLQREFLENYIIAKKESSRNHKYECPYGPVI